MIENKICILTPCHNAEATIKKTLESIIHQTYTNWVSVICFNCCTDNTKDVVQEFLHEHMDLIHKFHLIECNNIKGHCPARNFALFYGTQIPGITHFANLDSDDYWFFDKLERQMKYLEEHPEIDILGTQMRLIDKNNGSHLGYTNHPPDDETIKRSLLSSTNAVANSSALFKREVALRVGGYSDDLPLVEDYLFWLRAGRWFKFANLSDVLVGYSVWANPNYNPMSTQLASHIFNLIEKYFPGKT